MFKKNNNNFSFKNDNSFKERLEESSTIKKKYPDRIPIIVERANNKIEDIDKKKYLVPKDLTMGQFMHVVRQRIKLQSNIAIYLFINNIIPTTSELVNNLYDNYKDDDGFLYISYHGESTFG